jgi:hypothetical protein
VRGGALSGTLAVAAAASVLRGAVACSSDYAGAEDDAADGKDASTLASDTGEEASAQACPVRFLPAEGTYLYKSVYAADTLRIGDGGPLDTQPFADPFAATVKHEAGGCFTFTANLAEGSKGRHVHSWKFCNACDRSAPSLDVVEEHDDFEVTSFNSKQTTHYTCTRPNPFIVTDVPVDASVQQGTCTGETTGTLDNTLQILPTSYVYEGIRREHFESVDASIETYGYLRRARTLLVGGGGQATDDESTYRFDDAGLPMVFIVIAKTKTTFEGASVQYDLSMVGRRLTADVSPLPVVDP